MELHLSVRVAVKRVGSFLSVRLGMDRRVI